MLPKWSEVIDAANPARTPRAVFYQDQRFMPLEPATARQLERLRVLLQLTGTKPAEWFGEGYRSVEHLSSWSASCAIEDLRSLDARQQAEEQDVKRGMTRVLAEKYRHLPVLLCEPCGEARPHEVDSGSYICASCKGVTR
jgi:hypothetical protein